MANDFSLNKLISLFQNATKRNGSKVTGKDIDMNENNQIEAVEIRKAAKAFGIDIKGFNLDELDLTKFTASLGYFSDGMDKFETTTRDDAGNITNWEIDFDTNGTTDFRIGWTYDENGEPTGSTSYKLDEDGNTVQSVEVKDNKDTTTTNYNKQGSATEQFYDKGGDGVNDSITRWEYYDDGVTEKAIHEDKNANGHYETSTYKREDGTISSIKYDNDDEGHVDKTDTYYNNGEQLYYTKEDFNNDGKIDRQTVYNQDGTVKSVSERDKNSSSTDFETRVQYQYKDGKVYKKDEYDYKEGTRTLSVDDDCDGVFNKVTEYLANGNYIIYENTDDMGKYETKTEYNGNKVVKEVKYEAGTHKLEYEREYEYGENYKIVTTTYPDGKVEELKTEKIKKGNKTKTITTTTTTFPNGKKVETQLDEYGDGYTKEKNSKDSVTKETTLTNNKPTAIKEYEYYEDGVTVKKVYNNNNANKNDVFEMVEEYDNNGEIILVTYNDDSTGKKHYDVKTERNDKGAITLYTTTYYNKDETPQKAEINNVKDKTYSEITYTYNQDGTKETVETVYDTKNGYFSKVMTTVITTTYDKNGNPTDITTTEYNKQGNVTKETTVQNGNIIQIELHFYDENSNETSSNIVNIAENYNIIITYSADCTTKEETHYNDKDEPSWEIVTTTKSDGSTEVTDTTYLTDGGKRIENKTTDPNGNITEHKILITDENGNTTRETIFEYNGEVPTLKVITTFNADGTKTVDTTTFDEDGNKSTNQKTFDEDDNVTWTSGNFQSPLG